jgi:hypothetical protein
MSIGKKLEFTLEYNVVSKYIYTQLYMAEKDCKTLQTVDYSLQHV